jgi:hypothetical protein
MPSEELDPVFSRAATAGESHRPSPASQHASSGSSGARCNERVAANGARRKEAASFQTGFNLKILRYEARP